jgi:dTDP-glucose 4,6-dehydratase
MNGIVLVPVRVRGKSSRPMLNSSFQMMQRVVVSGGAGFIGSHMCDRLIAEGYSVVALDNLLTGAERNIRHLTGEPRFQFTFHDVTEPIDIDGTVDFVLHMASPASPKDYLEHPIETLDVGSLGTKQMLELAERKRAKFLLTSTSETYGDPMVHPQVETYWGNVNPVGPRSCYDESKRFAEAITMAYHRSRGVRTSIARIFNTYGPRMKLNDGRVVPAFLDQALRGEPITVFGDGMQTRSFCYVSDLVDGLYRLMLSGEAYPVNLGNPRELTMLEFARVIQAITGRSASIVHRPLPEDDPKQRKPDVAKANRILGWQPVVALEDGLRRTVAYFQNSEAGLPTHPSVTAI